MTRGEKERDMAIICDKCGCSDKARKRHYDQFVNHGWQPHASLRFKKWWFAQQEFKDSQDSEGNGIKAETAQNVDRIWEQYLNAKQIGAA